MKDLQDFKPLSWSEVLKSCWRFIEPGKTKFVVLVIILTLLYFNYLIPPYILARTVDFFTSYTPGTDLTQFYTLIAILGGTQIVVSIVRQMVKGAMARIAVNARYNTKVWGFDRLVELSLEWHQQENTGNKIQRIMTGSKAVENFMRILTNNILLTLITFIGTVLTTSLSNPWYLVFYTGYFLVMACIEIFFNRKINYLLDEYNKQQEQASGTFIEGASNMLAIKALGAKDTLSKKVIEKESAAKDVTYKKIHLRNLKWITFNTATAIIGSVFLITTAHDVMAGVISAGTIIMYWSYFFNFTQRVTDTVESFDDLLEVRSDISRMMPLYDANTFVHSGVEKFPPRWSKINFTHVSFTYATQAQAIQDLSLTIPKGGKIGVAGHSGSGKSTLVKLLLGLYQIQGGKITIGKQDLYDISHDELTKNIAIVLQETELFNLSLKENITMMREVPAKIISQAITVAQLEEVIQKLPHGIDTPIGEKGYALSGGERQRVGIARAICKNAQILLLDEATSALDSQTEEKVMKGIYNDLSKEKTIIIIAHRTSTLKNADKILVFDKGKIVEEGGYNELVSNKKSLLSAVQLLQK
jgi:ABC-type multidrug transport system fused ATPase/permease subunit